MKLILFILILFSFIYSISAQQIPKYNLVRPVAYEQGYRLSSPQKPKQLFIVELQDSTNDLLKILYFPKTAGLRGTKIDFVNPRVLNNETIWKLNLRNPSENENFYCKTNNFFEKGSKKKEPVLRFRSTQMDADIKFNNLSQMKCMILISFIE